MSSLTETSPTNNTSINLFGSKILHQYSRKICLDRPSPSLCVVAASNLRATEYVTPVVSHFSKRVLRVHLPIDCNTHVLRNWKFEGSENGVDWHCLVKHINDTSLKEAAGSSASWAIPYSPSMPNYTMFRLCGTGPNSAGKHHVMLGSIEIWGHMHDSSAK